MKVEIGKKLNPNRDLKGKQFFKVWHIINLDGTVNTRITLNVPNSEVREEIICKHYLAKYVKEVIKSDVGIELLSRDNPWDFEMLLSNGDKLVIEITAIADDVSMFRKLKHEDRIMNSTVEPVISLHELEKINRIFPNERTQAIINEYKSKSLSANTKVDNPYYQTSTFLFEGLAPVIKKEFGEVLMEAVDKKVNKNHQNKSDVVLIIDNRTVHYDLQDILSSLPNYTDAINNLDFKEVWIYTGYYSDMSGNDAEYSFISIKNQKLN